MSMLFCIVYTYIATDLTLQRRVRCGMGLMQQIGNAFGQEKGKKEIILIGLPNSGKTVFFCVGMELLQRRFNKLSDYYITYPDLATQKMVSDVIKELRAQKWPAKTMEVQEVCARISFAGHEREIICKDYGGGAFSKTFLSENIDEFIGNEKEYLKAIKSASSIALLIDSAMLCEEVDDFFYDGLHKMMSAIKDNKLKRFAIVFTKNDIAKLTPRKAEEKFESQCPNAYAHLKKLRKEYRFFSISSVQCVAVGGNYVPPEGYSPLDHSEGLDDLLYWLLEIEKPHSL